MPSRRLSWWVVVLTLGALGIGLLAGYVRWGRPFTRTQSELRLAGEIVRAPNPSALKDARPAAVIDLTSLSGTSVVKGTWHHTEAPSEHVRARGAGAFPDGRWAALDAPALERRRRTAPGLGQWYRLDVTIPERVGDFDTRASAVLLELAVEGYAGVWVNGALSPVLGQNGDSLVAGFNARNRIVLTHRANPGERFELTVLGVPGRLPGRATDTFSFRSATLDFVAPPREDHRGVGEVVRLDPGLDGILSKGARLEKVAQGLGYVEGPVWMPQGYLLFSDFRANLIYRWTADDGLSVFRTKSGYAGTDIGQYPLPGSNGLAVDRDGRLTIAEHGRRRIVRLEPNGDVTVLADSYDGRRLNSPNDLVYKSNGALYFTDPPFGLPDGHRDRRRELPYSGVFRWFGGRLDLLTSDLAGPNGLAFSPDERYLYVADWDKKHLVRYDVRDDGTLADSRIFFQMAIDGLKADERGNLYAAGAGGIWVLSPEGKALGVIKAPEPSTNMAWGGDDYRDLYLVGGSGVYRIRLDVSGARPWRVSSLRTCCSIQS